MSAYLVGGIFASLDDQFEEDDIAVTALEFR